MADIGSIQRKSAEQAVHEISVFQRKRMKISGVCEVIGFDSSFVELDTSCGRMFVDGADIKISVLDTERGVVELEGGVDSIAYSSGEQTPRKSLFKRSR